MIKDIYILNRVVLLLISHNTTLFLCMQFSRYMLTVLSVITYTNCFVYLITGKPSYSNSTALLIGLASESTRTVSLTCIYIYLNLRRRFRLSFFFFKFGGHLLSHTVTSAVPSAAWVLTIVFGMGTGVSPKRIATKRFRYVRSCRSFHLSRFRSASSR